MTDRFTDEQLREWLYDAEFDHEAVDGDHDFDANPLPRDTFPKYYADNYNRTLAALISEILDSRQRTAALLALHRPAPAHPRCQQADCPCGGYECCAHCDEYSARGVRWPCETYTALIEQAET